MTEPALFLALLISVGLFGYHKGRNRKVNVWEVSRRVNAHKPGVRFSKLSKVVSLTLKEIK